MTTQLATCEVIHLGNGVAITLAQDDGVFLGLGAVSVDGVPLRNSRRPLFVEIRTPNGVLLRDYRLRRAQADGDGMALDFTMNAQPGGLMDWMVHTVRNRYRTTDWTACPQPAEDTRLRLTLHPVTRRIGDVSLTGFRYQYAYASEPYPIYKILDRGTWEPGGAALGNSFWMRNCFVPCVTEFTEVAQPFSTEWFVGTCTNPSIFQFVPLQTELQGFTFTAGPHGVLLSWPTAVAHVRSLFEKPRGENLIVHWHEHCGDLAPEFITSPMEVLFTPDELAPVDCANLYHAMRDLVSDTLHAQLGMERDRVTTYGFMEEWFDADLPRYTARGVPKLLDAGVKTIYTQNHFQNNMNTYGAFNMCCTVDYKIAETVGEENFRAFCAAVHAGGARTEMWGNTSISTLTEQFTRRHGTQKRIDFLPEEDSIIPLLRTAQDPFVRNPSNAIEADHYTPLFAVLNLRDPDIRAYWLQRWAYAHDALGLDGLFLDSSFNLSSDKFHFIQNTRAHHQNATPDSVALLGKYRPAQDPPQAIFSMYRAHLELIAEMQAMGYTYCCEDLGLFGVSRHGPDLAERLTALHLWSDCLTDFDVPTILALGRDPDDVFFRGLAYRMIWMLFWHAPSDEISYAYQGVRDTYDRPTPWQISLFKAYNAVESLLYTRTILPEETGVLYRKDGRQVLWAFTDLTLPLDGARPVRELLTGNTVTTDCLEAGRRQVYVIG